MAVIKEGNLQLKFFFVRLLFSFSCELTLAKPCFKKVSVYTFLVVPIVLLREVSSKGELSVL